MGWSESSGPAAVALKSPSLASVTRVTFDCNGDCNEDCNEECNEGGIVTAGAESAIAPCSTCAGFCLARHSAVRLRCCAFLYVSVAASIFGPGLLFFRGGG